MTINRKFDNLIMLCVSMNTLSMALDTLWPELNLVSDIMTYVFLGEAVLKIFSLGFRDYVRDKLNVFDLLLVIISLIEDIFLGDNSGVSGLRSIRLFRILRVTRLMRTLKYMKVIVKVVNDSISSAISIAMLLSIFISVYCILGIKFYQNKLSLTGQDKPYRQNFNNIQYAFFSIF